MRRLLAAAALVAVAVPMTGTATARGVRGVGLSASPVRLTLTRGAGAAITLRNPGAKPLRVAVSRAGFARSLRGRPRIRAARDAARWLRLRPRRIRLAPRATRTLHVRALPPPRTRPGDHPLLLLLTTRPPGTRHVRVRLRVGVVVVVHVAGRTVRRLDPRAVTVRRRGARRLLELRLVNRGNVVEQLDRRRLRIVLLRGRRRLATLGPRRQELLPHSTGIAEFVYHGRARGRLVARVEVAARERNRSRSFRVRF